VLSRLTSFSRVAKAISLYFPFLGGVVEQSPLFKVRVFSVYATLLS
jgi:hypothetical protein